MASSDYDVMITGSGLGGSVASLINGPATDALGVYELQEGEDAIQIRA
jgi:hypothetical protein